MDFIVLAQRESVTIMAILVRMCNRDAVRSWCFQLVLQRQLLSEEVVRSTGDIDLGRLEIPSPLIGGGSDHNRAP